MATFQLEKIASRSSAGSTASDGWLWYPFDSSFSLGSEYVVEWVYVRISGLKSASGQFTGDVPIQIITAEGDYDLGEIKGYTFPASSSSSGVQISGYLDTPSSVLAKLATASIERVDVGQSTYAGGKDIRCFDSSQCSLIIGYNYAYTRCTPPESVSIKDSITPKATNTLTWSAGGAGTNNAVSGYFIQYADSADNKTWSAWKELKTVGNVTSAEVDMPAGNTYRKYKVWTLGAAGSEWRSETGTESSGSTYRGHDELAEFTDSPLVAGETYVKSLHMLELQDRANTLRGFYGMKAYGFSTITGGTTGLKDWTAHVNEIRAAVDEISTDHAAWISFSVNCPRADVIEQLRAVILAM